MKINRKYAEHSAGLSAVVAYISDENGAPTPAALRLGISAAEIENLRDLRAKFDSAFAAYSSPETHTPIAVQEMGAADAAAFAAVLSLRRRLKNGTAKLTSEDYANLGIHEDKKTRTRAKTPVDAPILLLTNSAPLSLAFAAAEVAGETEKRAHLPRGWRIAREMANRPQGVEPADGDFRALNSVGRSRFAVSSTAAQVGMNAHLRIAYENAAGRGPFSLPVKAIII